MNLKEQDLYKNIRSTPFTTTTTSHPTYNSSRPIFDHNTSIDSEYTTNPLKNNQNTSTMRQQMSFSSLKDIGSLESQRDNYNSLKNDNNFSYTRSLIERSHNAQKQEELYRASKPTPEYPNFGYMNRDLEEGQRHKSPFVEPINNFPRTSHDQRFSPSHPPRDGARSPNPKESLNTSLHAPNSSINFLHRQQSDQSAQAENNMDYINNYLWKLKKEKERYHARKARENSPEQLHSTSFLSTENSQKFLLDRSSRNNLSPRREISKKSHSPSRHESSPDTSFNILIEKQRKFYEMLNNSASVYRPERSPQPSERSPSPLKNLLKSRSEIKEIGSRISLGGISSGSKDENMLELEILKQAKRINNYEKSIAEKIEELEELKTLFMNAGDEIERLNRQRESDMMIMAETEEEHSKEKRALQGQLEKALDKLISSSNSSINQNLSNVLGISAGGTGSMVASLREEKNRLEEQLKNVEKELEFQKRSNETMKKRINVLLTGGDGGENNIQTVQGKLTQQEMSSLLKEYLNEIEDLRNRNLNLENNQAAMKTEMEDKVNSLAKEMEENNKKSKQIQKDWKEIQKEKEKLMNATETVKAEYEKKLKVAERQAFELEQQNTKIKEENERNKKTIKRFSEAKGKEGGGGGANFNLVYEEQIEELNNENEELRQKIMEAQILERNLREELDQEKSLREEAENNNLGKVNQEELDALQVELEKARSQIKELQKVQFELETLQDAHDELEQEYTSQMELYRILEDKFRSHQQHGEEHQNLLSEQNTLLSHEKEHLSNRIQMLENEITVLSNSRESLIKQLEEVETLRQNNLANEKTIKDLEKALKDSELDKKNLNMELENIEEKLRKGNTEYEERLRRANDEVQNLSEQIRLLSSGKNTNSAVKELQAQNEKLRDEAVKVRKLLEQKTAEAENESFMQKFQSEQLKIVVEEQDEKIRELESQLKSRPANASTNNNNENSSQKDQIIENLKKEIQNLKSELATAQTTAASSRKPSSEQRSDRGQGDSSEELEQMKTIVEKQKTVLQRNKDEINDLNQAIKDYKQMLEDAEIDFERVNKKVKENEETIAGYESQMTSLIEKITEASMKEQEYLQQIRTLKKK